MKLRLALALLTTLALAACSPKTPEAAPAADAPTATEAAPAETAPAPGADEAAPAAPTAPEAPAPAAQPYTGPALIPGVDYVEIAGGKPLEPNNGQIEVVEFFSYICPACFAFEPSFKAWKARQAADVRVTPVPATFRPDFASYAKAYYAADALGVAAKSHEDVYKAIHLQNTLPGEGKPFDEAKITAFYVARGADATQYKAALGSFAVAGKINKAKQFLEQSKIQGTPSLVVDGKYLVKGKSWEDMLRIADGLVAQQRAKGVQ